MSQLASSCIIMTYLEIIMILNVYGYNFVYTCIYIFIYTCIYMITEILQSATYDTLTFRSFVK